MIQSVWGTPRDAPGHRRLVYAAGTAAAQGQSAMQALRILLAFVGLFACTLAQAGPTFPSAADTDPAKLGWMQGSPPPADKLISSEGTAYWVFPRTRWSFAHMRQYAATVNVWRGDGGPSALPRAERADIDAVRFTPTGAGTTMSWEESLAANYTDAIVVLHRGRIVYERYLGVMTPHTPHIAMSVTKSFIGTLAATLVAEGKLDPQALVPRYIPELADSAFGDATVRQVLDMTTGIDYSEDYTDPNADIWKHSQAGSVFQRPADYQGPRNYYESLQQQKKLGEHGQAFAYKSINTDVAGWLVRRVTGKSLAEVLSERIWQPLGAEQDAYMIVDSAGIEFAAGGLNPALRDMARFGEMMRNDGRFNGRQIVPKAAVEDIRRGASRDDFAKAGYATLPGWSYHHQWWVSHDDHGAFTARGVHGQAIYIDPKAEMVIARFGSHPLAANANFDATSLPAYRALAEHLMK
jgi:hypothetical protein